MWLIDCNKLIRVQMSSTPWETALILKMPHGCHIIAVTGSHVQCPKNHSEGQCVWLGRLVSLLKANSQP